MSIAVTCDNCRVSFRAKDEHAGKRGKCPKCRGPIVVPQLEVVEELIELPVVGEVEPEKKASPDSEELIALPVVGEAEPEKKRQADSEELVALPVVDEAKPKPKAWADSEELIALPVVEDVQRNTARAPSPPATQRPAPAAKPPAPTARPAVQAPPPRAAVGSGLARTEAVAAELVTAEVVAELPPPPAPKRKAAPPPQRKSYAQWQQEVLAGFHGTLEPVEVPSSYRFAAGLVSAGMVLLPVLYLAIIAVLGYLVLYSEATIVSIIGGVLILFMLKPIFAKPGKARPPRELTAEQEPLLFAFIARLCEAVGAPQPKQIVVNCDVNASAGFRKGFLSIIARQDLVLVIGLPLVAGLTLRQFAGVLAHEFGHFTQGAGMRLGYVIRMINLWFVRVVYERDAWDERLEWLAARGGGRLWLVLQSIRFSVWLSRRVLWLLMKAAQAMSCYLSRQMEFHADKYFFRLVGAETMAAAFHRLPILAFASEGAWSDLDDFYRDGRLGDNLPKLIIANVKQFSKEVLAQIDKTVDETESSVFNTHPADKVRIAQAAAENPAGVFRIEAPAAVLFRDFDNLSRQSTWDQYVELFDGQVQANQVHPVDELIARQERDIAGNKAIGRFFQGSFTVLRPLPVANWSSLLKQDAQSAATTLRRARDKMLAIQSQFDTAYKTYDAADTLLIEAAQADAVLRAKFRVAGDTFSQPMSSPAEVNDARSSAANHQAAVADTLRDFEQAAAQRIMAAVRLLGEPRVAAQIDDLEMCRWEADRYAPTLGRMYRLIDAVIELRNARAVLVVLLGSWEGNEENRALAQELRAAAETVSSQVNALHAKLADESYPFDHAKGQITMAQFLFDTPPPADDLGAVWQASETMVEQLLIVYLRLVGRLTHITELVETAIGLPLLPDPPEKEGA